jgi:hypothetical protein
VLPLLAAVVVQQTAPAAFPHKAQTPDEHLVLEDVHNVPVDVLVAVPVVQQGLPGPPQVPALQLPLAQVPGMGKQLPPLATQRLETQQPLLWQVLPEQHSWPGPPQATELGALVPPVPTGMMAPPVPIAPPMLASVLPSPPVPETGIAASDRLPPVPMTTMPPVPPGTPPLPPGRPPVPAGRLVPGSPPVPPGVPPRPSTMLPLWPPVRGSGLSEDLHPSRPMNQPTANAKLRDHDHRARLFFPMGKLLRRRSHANATGIVTPKARAPQESWLGAYCFFGGFSTNVREARASRRRLTASRMAGRPLSAS